VKTSNLTQTAGSSEQRKLIVWVLWQVYLNGQFDENEMGTQCSMTRDEARVIPALGGKDRRKSLQHQEIGGRIILKRILQG
jgi:hypothetical protein